MNGSLKEKVFDLSTSMDGLRDSREYIRLAALAELLTSGTKSPDVIEGVSARLDDPSQSARSLAVLVLAQVGAPSATVLIRALGEKQPIPVRVATAAGLGRIGVDAAAAIHSLCQCLENDDELLRWHASFALSKIGVVAVPSLQRMLKSSDPKVIYAALNSLEWIGKDAKIAFEDIKQLISISSPLVQLACYSALVKISGDPSKGLPNLQSILEEKDPDIRKACVERIGYLGEIAREATPLLIKCLSDQSGPVRAASALALARIGLSQSEAVEGLTRLLDDPEIETRANAGVALASLGSTAASALPALRIMQQDKEPRLAAIANVAIESIEKGNRNSRDH
jgi:HEAT repeat protein